jgi:D-serine deaminase-like pyridoxal phosphate-dependent protein
MTERETLMSEPGSITDFPTFAVPSSVETPSLCVDEGRMQRNIEGMIERLTAKGVTCRPHVKSHKNIEIGRRQLAAGAKGLTVATIGEAEVFVGAGVTDIFIAYPLWVSDEKARRLRALHESAHVAVGLSSVAAAENLSRALGSPSTLNVLIEVDSGEQRTGVLTAGEALEVARACDRLGLNLKGVFAHAGHSYAGASAVAGAAHDEASSLITTAEALRQAGHHVETVSAGSTPTALLSAVEGVTEERPGTFVFGDRQQVVLGAHRADGVALFVATTVVQVTGDRFVIDAAAKVLTKDLPPTVEGYGALVDYPDARVERVYDHHGVVDARGGPIPRVGDRLALIPNHVCPVTNLARELIVLDDHGDEVDRWKVNAGLRNI